MREKERIFRINSLGREFWKDLRVKLRKKNKERERTELLC